MVKERFEPVDVEDLCEKVETLTEQRDVHVGLYGVPFASNDSKTTPENKALGVASRLATKIVGALPTRKDDSGK